MLQRQREATFREPDLEHNGAEKTSDRNAVRVHARRTPSDRVLSHARSVEPWRSSAATALASAGCGEPSDSEPASSETLVSLALFADTLTQTPAEGCVAIRRQRRLYAGMKPKAAFHLRA